jgi:AbrB family looped-hinge helix DNA binding protein
MNTTVGIDKARRIVVPKKLRDALNLTPGTRLKVVRSGEWLMLTPSYPEAQLIIENGAPLIFPADSGNAPIFTNEAVNELIAQGRLECERRFLGLDRDTVDVPLGAAE